MTHLQKLPKNVGKIIVAAGFKELPKVQEIAQSGHTVPLELQNIPGTLHSIFRSLEVALGKQFWN